MPDVLDEELKRLDLMERPIGIEPTPEPWQGSVLPLYYGRFVALLFIARSPSSGQGPSGAPVPRCTPQLASRSFSCEFRRSRNLADARGLDHRRSPLPVRKAPGLVFVGVHATELFPIGVIHRHQVMVMLAAAVLFEARLFPWFFCRHFDHGHRFLYLRKLTPLWQGNEIHASTIRESNVNCIITEPRNIRRSARSHAAGIPPTLRAPQGSSELLDA